MSFFSFLRKIENDEKEYEEEQENVNPAEEKKEELSDDWMIECSIKLGKVLKIIFIDINNEEKIFYCFTLLRNNVKKLFKLIVDNSEVIQEISLIKSYKIYELQNSHGDLE